MALRARAVESVDSSESARRGGGGNTARTIDIVGIKERRSTGLLLAATPLLPAAARGAQVHSMPSAQK